MTIASFWALAIIFACNP